MFDFPNANISLQERCQLALKKRLIYFYDSINDSSMKDMIYILNYLMTNDKNPKPFDILINSPGGDVDETFQFVSVIEIMKESGYEITTVNMQKAMSGGFIMAICGTHRLALRHSKYLWHDASAGCFGGTTQQIIRFSDEMESYRKELNDIIMKYTDLDERYLNDIYSKVKDHIFTSKDVIAYNIADKII